MWISCQTDGYLYLKIQYVDAKWNLDSKVLNFLHTESPQKGHAMYSSLSTIIRDWVIEHNFFPIMLDDVDYTLLIYVRIRSFHIRLNFMILISDVKSNLCSTYFGSAFRV